METTLAIVKPDAVTAGNAGKILAHLEQEGFTLRALRLVRLTRAQAEGFYAVHRERPFFGSLVEFMTSGPCLPVALERENAQAQLREVMGATDVAKAAGEGFALVYFYPKADTAGCTKQACSLRDAYATLGEKGMRVFGVSSDGVAAQKAFQEKYKLPFTLLADSDKKVIEAFGVPTRLGFASRQAFLFRDGKLVWRDLSASTEQQAADVLAAIEELAKGS